MSKNNPPRNFFKNIYGKGAELLQKDFNLVKNIKYFLIAPLVIFLAGIIVFAIIGFNMGLDFTGGTVLKVKFGTSISEEEYTQYRSTVEDAFTNNGILRYSLQREGEGSSIAISVKFQNLSGKTDSQMDAISTDIKEEILQAFESVSKLSQAKVEDSLRIGATASRDLILNALLAVGLALLGMAIYIAFRFELASAIATSVALFHDILIMSALVIIFRIEINSPFIAALITVLGYSINNNIIVFDRVRENLRVESNKNLSNAKIIDISIKDTLTRTSYTMLTTLFAIILLAAMGVPSIREFTIPILFGLLAGTYSSLFIVGPVWAFIYKREKDKRLAKKMMQKLEENKTKKDEDKIVV